MHCVRIIFILFHLLFTFHSSLYGQRVELIDTLHPKNDIELTSKFGESLSVNDDVAVVGMPESGKYAYRAGQVFIYQKIENEWIKVVELKSPDPQLGAYFGKKVAIYQNTIVVSALRQDLVKTNEGALYVYEKTGEDWTSHALVGTLSNSEPQENTGLGDELVINENIIAASSILFDSLGGNDVGRVLVFEKPVSGWSDMQQTANLFSSKNSNYADFGYSLAVKGDTIAVGARNSGIDETHYGLVYFYFKEPNEGWSNRSESTYIVGRKGADYYFGSELILTDKFLLVGNGLSGSGNRDAPVVQVYNLENNLFNHQATLTPLNIPPSNFSSSISMYFDGNKIYQAIFSNSSGAIPKGAVFEYEKSSEGWVSTYSSRMITSNTENNARENFGTSIAGNNSDILIGNPTNINNRDTGGVVHVIDKNSFSETDQLSSSVSTNHKAKYGNQIKVSGNFALIRREQLSTFGLNGVISVLKRTGSEWHEIGEIQSPSYEFSSFGNNFDIYGRTIAVSVLYREGINQGGIFVYKIEEDTVYSDRYDVIKPSLNNTVERFGISLDLKSKSLVVAGYKRGSSRTNNVLLFVFDRENLLSDSFKQTAVLPLLDSDVERNYSAKNIQHNQDMIIVTMNDPFLGSIFSFKKGNSWLEASKTIIANPENSSNDSYYTTFSSSGYLTDSYYITHDYHGDDGRLYSFRINDSESTNYDTYISKNKNFSSNFYGSGSLGISGNRIGSIYSQQSDRATLFQIDNFGGLDSLLTITNPGIDLESDFGNTIAIDGVNILISAPNEDNDKGLEAGAVYAYSTDQAKIEKVFTDQEAGKYGPGETIEINIKLSEPVDVNGAPNLELNLENDSNGRAYYKSGTGTTLLTFSYEILVGDHVDILDYSAPFLKLDEENNITTKAEGQSINPVLPPIGADNSILNSSIISIDAQSPKIEFINSKNRYNDSFELKVSFNKEISGLDVSDFNVENVNVNSIQKEGIIYKISLTPLEEGEFNLQLKAGSVQDNYGLLNEQSENLILIYETTSPEYILPETSIVSSSNIIDFSFESTEEAQVLIDQLRLTNLSIISYTEDSTAHSLKFLVIENGTTANCIFQEGSLVDEAGNLNKVAGNLEILFDLKRPVITLEDVPEYLESGENAISLLISEEVTNLQTNKVEVENADFYIKNENNRYSLILTPSGSNKIYVKFLEGTVQDFSGNENIESRYTLNYDKTNPKVAYTLKTVEENHIELKMEFNELVNEIKPNYFEINGVDSIYIKKLINNAYIIHIFPHFRSNITLSLKNDLVSDKAGNFVDPTYFEHIITSIHKNHLRNFVLFWNGDKETMTVSLNNQVSSGFIYIYDLYGKKYYDFILEQQNTFHLKNIPKFCMALLEIDGKVSIVKFVAEK